MLAYLLRRLLLTLPTLLGVLLLTFVVLQFVPGGPVEQYLMEAKAGSVAGLRGGSGSAGGMGAEGGSIYQGQRGVDPQLTLVAHWLMAWGDAIVTGMLCAIFVAFRPQWLATWSDRLYLRP